MVYEYFYPMRYALICSFLFMTTVLRAQVYTNHVDPMTGTGGVGHTYPGATLPYGMVQLSPDTRRDGSWEGCAGYYHRDSLVYGFSHTHLSGTGCSDYGDILLMPGIRQTAFDPLQYASVYRHAAEEAYPGYYAVTLEKDAVRAELTATTRCGFHRYTFPGNAAASLLLDLRHRDKTLDARLVLVSPTRIEGFRRSEAWAKDQYIFFSLELSRPVDYVLTNREGKVLKPGMEMVGPDLAVVMQFPSSGEPLLVKVGISTVDEAGARNNLTTELPGWDFAKTRVLAAQAWNKELSRIDFKSDSPRDLKNFYTSLYHTMVVPNVLSDVDGRYRGRDNKIHTAEGYTQYTVFSLWDTFRAAHPLYTLLDTHRTRDYIRTFLAQYRQGGRLPVWELGANETDCMIGYHSVPVMADALVKGVGGFDTTLALEAMMKSAEWDHLGLPAYRQNGFIGVEDEHESVSKTLEYAYDDWCIAVVADMLGRKQEAAAFRKRAASYRNLYDAETGFMRPRRNGAFISAFDPREVNNHYTEANSWQYSFFVPHDVAGLIELMGGDPQAEAKLDGLFSAPSRTTGRSQADITGMIGQYAHGNEPSHHMAYLYDHIGRPWKTQSLVRTILDSLYQPGPEGLPGNEDCGQMSAWYVWSALGFYPVTPGKAEYAIGSPAFTEATIRLENGHQIRMKAPGNKVTTPYIRSLTIDGRKWTSNFISHAELIAASEIVFGMGAEPDTLRATAPDAGAPMSRESFMRAPLIVSSGRLFTDSMLVSIVSPDGGAVRYCTKAGDWNNAQTYEKPFYIHEPSTLYVQASDAAALSGTATASFYRIPSDRKVTLLSKTNPQYNAEGPVSMIDGIRGTGNWRKGDWHGYQSTDMLVEMRFDKTKSIRKVKVGYLQDTRSWILMPRETVVEISSDGKVWSEVARRSNTVPDKVMDVTLQDMELDFAPVSTEFLRVKAVNYGVLPTWHQGAGYDAFIFCDEIIVQ
jgi:predicted alpha-1,2-mannosidase